MSGLSTVRRAGRQATLRLGNYKYMVCIPFLVKAAAVGYAALLQEAGVHNHRKAGAIRPSLVISCVGRQAQHNWCFLMLLLAVLRYLQAQLWITFSRLHGLNKKYLIRPQGTTFQQIDQHSNWDDYIIFQAIMATAAHAWLPSWKNMSFWAPPRAVVLVLLMHCGPVEMLHYCLHRLLHGNSYLFSRFHRRCHQFQVTEPCAGVSSWLEPVAQAALLGLALSVSFAGGGPSVLVLVCYTLTFDFLRSMCHCNVEIIPRCVVQAFPPLKLLVSTPSYHSLHHTGLKSNFCLFMPLYDYLGGTRDSATDFYHSSMRRGRQDSAPQFVFLAHCIDILSSPHVPFVFRSLAAHPYASQWYLWLTWPLSCLAMLIMWAFARTFVSSKYMFDGMSVQTWVLPRYGFQYFLPFGLGGINKLIEQAIVDADKAGVKVISLAALNKNEALNGGGTLFVNSNPNLTVRLVHGNTLTAAVVVHAIPPEVSEVFLTGATSKLGRAIALYLCRRGVRVLMLTRSKERFNSIVKDAIPRTRHCLVQVTKFEAGQHCKTWIVGKWMTAKEQSWAPPKTHFHQFVVPAMKETRKDCSYGKLAGLRLPLDCTQGINSCELSMPRGVVHACHAGGLIHALEGWQHHEVGSIDVDRIDLVWEIALRHGFTVV